MVLLMVVTVIYAPVVVPLAVAGATVEAWDIASSLIVLMLIPLGVAALLVSWQHIVGAVGSWIFVGVAIVLVAGLAAGYLSGIGRVAAERGRYHQRGRDVALGRGQAEHGRSDIWPVARLPFLQ